MPTPERDQPAGAEPGKSILDVGKLADGVSIRSVMLTILAVLAVLYTLHFARPVLMPLALAVLLSLVLMPLVRILERKLRLPQAGGAALLLIVLVLGVALMVYHLSGPAMTWLREMPQSFDELEQRLRFIREPVEDIQKAAEKVEEATSLDSQPGIEVKMQAPSTGLQMLIEGARGFIAGLVLVGAFLFFLLATGDTFLLKLVRIIRRFEDKKKAVTIAHQIQEEIGHYALTITLINAGLGLATGGVLFALGVPNAALWGVMAAVLNYIPYLGAIVGVAIVGMVSLITFDSVGYALLAPLAYLVLTSVEANFVTPLILGKRLLLNPLMLFTCVIFWGWLWGIPGALIAVPITVAMRITFDHIEQTRSLAEFFGR